MIYSEIVETVYSNLENEQILSSEEPDFRFLDESIRLLEDNDERKLEDDTLRILE